MSPGPSVGARGDGSRLRADRALRRGDRKYPQDANGTDQRIAADPPPCPPPRRVTAQLRPRLESAVVQSVITAFWASVRLTSPAQTALLSLFSTVSLSEEASSP